MAISRDEYDRNRRLANGDTAARRRLHAAVYAPDPLICHLCGERIDKRLPWQHPMAKSVDHVVPIAHGGAPLDPANCRPAHRRCNFARGAGSPVGAQLHLVVDEIDGLLFNSQARPRRAPQPITNGEP